MIATRAMTEAIQKALDDAEATRGKYEPVKIVEEAPWAFLYQPDWIVVVSKDFTGFAKVNDLNLRFAYMGKKQE